MKKINKNPNIQILLATYNGEKFLREQIDSILNQEYKLWELLIHDDGSVDNTISILNEYQNNYPKKIKTSYKRYVENQFRKNFDLIGIPIHLSFRRK